MPPLSRLIALTLLWPPLAAAQISGAPEPFDEFGSALAAGDFDGDGRVDLAIGAWGEDVGTLNAAGAVNVLYCTLFGFTDGGNQLWTQNSPGVGDVAEEGDFFGVALAAGDFDGDGYDDLAIGSSREDFGALSDVGQVHVLYGSAAGLTATGSFYLPSVPGAHASYYLGDELAAGDFDGDGFDDLAVGGPGRNIGSATGAGLTAVLFGSANGLLRTGYQVWHQNTPGIAGTAETFDRFGSALAAGDFDDDGFDDLAIGVRGDTAGGIFGTGAAHVLYGGPNGPTATGADYWWQGASGIAGDPEVDEDFGYSLTVGNFDGDAYDDLAIGVVFESVGTADDAGAVNVIYGTSTGLASAGNQLWYQDVGSIVGISADDDEFGRALASTDFDGDGYDDLAVGVLFEDVGGVTDAGAVNVLYGTAAGLDDARNQLWWQGSTDIQGDPETGDWFGDALAAADFNGGGGGDLAIGAPGEDVGGNDRAGSVNVLYGNNLGLSSALNQILYQGLNLRIGNPSSDPVTAGASLEPGALAFLPASPNPFAGRTTLRFALPEAGPVRLTVFDALGREVARVVDEARAAGPHAVTLDAGALPSGTYLVRLEAGGRVLTQRLTLAR
jgi:hypothetical protein